jgi:hypothetical protein
MKKIFSLQDEKRDPARVVEAIKNELRKYLKREKKKKLPSGADFWDFDCRFGETQEESKEMTFNQLIRALDEVDSKECYIEIVAKVGVKVVEDNNSDE